MRYLYGDSFPFQLQYDFLATLETFVSSGARAVKLARECEERRATFASGRALREKGLGELEAFNKSLVAAVHACEERATTPAAIELAKQVQEFATRALDEARRRAKDDDEREAAETERDIEAKRKDVQRAVETFLLAGRLPTIDARISMHLLGEGKASASAVLHNPEHIATSFELAPHESAAWRRERKVSDFARGIGVQVGVKKSLFKRTMQPEVVHLDDLVVGGFELSDDAAEIRLRKKADAKDHLVFTLKREGDALIVECVREGEESATPLDGDDKQELEKLWQLLRAGASELLAHKERVLSVSLDEADLFEDDARVSQLFRRIVKLFAPIVAEIQKRSPSPAELSLKLEDDAGKRQELYVKKQDLLDKLAALDDGGRALFAPLFGTSPPPEKTAGRDEMPSLDISIDTMDE